MATVDVVIVAYNSREQLRGCVEPFSQSPDIHVIVVDNASPDSSLEVIEELPVERMRLSQNGGFGVGCNAGARAGSAPFLLFLNPDARIEPPALLRLVELLRDDTATGLIAPKIFQPDGTLHCSQRWFPSVTRQFATALFLHRLWPRARWADEVIRDASAYERVSYPDWVSGACMLLRRDDFEALGGFDEGFFLYSEDADLCRRVRDRGLRVRFEPSVSVVHEGGASAPRPSLFAELARSRIRYAAKHFGPLKALQFRAAIALGGLIRMLTGGTSSRSRRGHMRVLATAVVRPQPRR